MSDKDGNTIEDDYLYVRYKTIRDGQVLSNKLLLFIASHLVIQNLGNMSHPDKVESLDVLERFRAVIYR